MARFMFVLAAIVLFVAASLPSVSAEVIFYNGDFRDMDNLSCERNTGVTDSRVYENFRVDGAWQITNMWGHFYQNNTNPVSQAYFEVRQGISAGNGGTLVASGNIDATKTAVAVSGWGGSVYRIDAQPVGLILGTGDYWMTIAPIGPDNSYGQWWILGSTGVNKVGSASFDGVSCWDSTYWHKQWLMLPNRDTSEGNWSLGISGTSVPEPSSLIALLCGLGGVGSVLRPKRR